MPNRIFVKTEVYCIHFVQKVIPCPPQRQTRMLAALAIPLSCDPLYETNLFGNLLASSPSLSDRGELGRLSKMKLLINGFL